MTNDVDVLKRQLAREKKSRHEAERLLEEKSRELYEAVLASTRLAQTLEIRVKERTQALEAARDAAERSNRAKSYFLANVSHEIRTPLNGMLGLLELLGLSNLDAVSQSYISVAIDAGESLISLINEILDTAKIDAGKLALETISFDPAAVINEASQVFRVLIDEKGLLLDICVDDAVPKVLVGDPVRLRQIISNLISNAQKFTTSGSIRIKVNYVDQQLHISVKDTGIGMSENETAKIFDLFTQSDSAITRKFGGTGLGLSICKQLTELMGGDIHVTSVPQEGTEFILSLPMAIGSIEALPSVKSTALVSKKPMFSNEQTVLVVDDNAVNRMVASAMLRSLGLTAQEAAGGQEAIDLIRDNHFSLVLMDVQMPEVDGITATKTIRSWGDQYEKLPIIALTAQALHGDRETAMQGGMNDYITKPVNRRELYDTLSGWLPVLSSPS